MDVVVEGPKETFTHFVRCIENPGPVCRNHVREGVRSGRGVGNGVPETKGVVIN
jgi:hypothetical protein